MQCYYCLNAITDGNKSVEHIIPNSIGGRLKSKELLCNTCNSILGRTIDSTLYNQLHPLVSFLNIEREKGSPSILKNLKSTNEQRYNLVDGRKPVLVNPSVAINREKNTVHITARDEKELRKIIKQLKKKHPNIDDEDYEKKAQKQRYFMDDKISIPLVIGNDNFLKGILKIAINSYLYFISKDIKQISPCISILKSSEPISTDIIHHYYFDKAAFITEDEVSHNILIKGIPEQKLLFCYVELFSCLAFIVNLDKNYQGKDLIFNYSYDVLKRKVIDKSFDVFYEGGLKGDKTLLNNQFIKILQRRFSRVFNIADKIHIDITINEIVQESMDLTLGKYPEGILITEEIIREFADELSKRAAPFIAHLHRKD